jgi:four helix bundle protein
MSGGKIQRIEDMPVFERFYQLATDIEKATRVFGPDFRWLRSQVMRSSESVCANMTGGFYSQYSTEYLQALYRCRREARETLVHLRYVGDTGKLSRELLTQLQAGGEDALQQLAALIVSIKRKIADRGKTKPGALLIKEADADYAPFPSTMNHQP